MTLRPWNIHVFRINFYSIPSFRNRVMDFCCFYIKCVFSEQQDTTNDFFFIKSRRRAETFHWSIWAHAELFRDLYIWFNAYYKNLLQIRIINFTAQGLSQSQRYDNKGLTRRIISFTALQLPTPDKEGSKFQLYNRMNLRTIFNNIIVIIHSKDMNIKSMFFISIKKSKNAEIVFGQIYQIMKISSIIKDFYVFFY